MADNSLHKHRLESLGELAASLAHELNQPLNVIRMACENLDMHLEGRDLTAQIKLAKIIDQVDRASRIIESIGVFSRVDRRPPERYNVRDVLDRVDALLARPLRQDGIRLVIRAEDDLPFLEGNAVLVDQMLFNLVNNARDAILEKRRDEGDTEEGGEVRLFAGWSGDEYLILRVEDTGKGLAGLDPKFIFEPFFTTKEDRGGSGLGLSLCRKIALSLGGTIGCAPSGEGGAVFTVHIPVPPQRRPETQPADSPNDEP